MYGLDRPVFVQYGRWMGNLFRGDLGLSFSSNQPVVNLIRRPIQNSMVLTITALVLLWLMAIPLGVYSAVRPYSLGDQAVAGMTSTGHENLGCVDQLLDIAPHHPARVRRGDGRHRRVHPRAARPDARAPR